MREAECLQWLVSVLPADALVIAHTGNTSNLLSRLRPGPGNLYQINLGQCTAVGLGLALALPHRRVIVLDGDGNLLLNLATLADVARQQPPNLLSIVLDNEAYESCDCYPSATAGVADLAAMARGAGIGRVVSPRTLTEFQEAVGTALRGSTFFLIVAKVEAEHTRLPSQRLDGRENTYRFVRYIEESEGRAIFNPDATHFGMAAARPADPPTVGS